MIDNLIRDLQVLAKADTLIGKIWVSVTARRLGLLAFAGQIAVFGLAMANVAGFYALQVQFGSVWAAAVSAGIDFVIALTIALLARASAPGPELELAMDVRRMAVEAIDVDARDLKAAIDAFGREIRDAREHILGFVHNPLDVAAQRLLIPAALSLVRGFRSRKTEG